VLRKVSVTKEDVLGAGELNKTKKNNARDCNFKGYYLKNEVRSNFHGFKCKIISIWLEIKG
jgi:hypothetical protein